MLFTPSTYLSSNCAREYLYIVVAFATNSISARTNYERLHQNMEIPARCRREGRG